MHRQKSFSNDFPKCYVVATPIGNLEEMTPRAIAILKEVDVIACEDTRHTAKLLAHFDIHTKLISHQKFNEHASVKGIMMLLHKGYNVALVSDAGYPLIADPGHVLVQSIIKHGYNVIPISGSSALLNALVASGVVTHPFYFHGFLPNNQKELKGLLTRIRHYQSTLVFYEAPHRIEKTLKVCLELLGDRKACLARELTKLHEEFVRGSLSDILQEADTYKGEIVLVIEGDEGIKVMPVDMNEVYQSIEELIQSGLSAKDAIKEVSTKTGVSKNQCYEIYHSKRC
jgi:16S rRNA (cytidine1402-2'-O)-methyltransferase